jgi:hypothetical protein
MFRTEPVSFRPMMARVDVGAAGAVEHDLLLAGRFASPVE